MSERLLNIVARGLLPGDDGMTLTESEYAIDLRRVMVVSEKEGEVYSVVLPGVRLYIAEATMPRGEFMWRWRGALEEPGLRGY